MNNINKNPLVTIIIPCYNSANSIDKTLYYVMNQTYSNIEVVVVDDGSKDETVQVINSIMENNKINYKIVQQQNQGVSIARNVGLNHANGEYILFLDSDDYIELELVEIWIRKVIDFDLDVVFCGYDYIDKHGIVISEFNRNFQWEKNYIDGISCIKKLLNCELSIQTINVLIKKKILIDNNILYTPKCYYGEDLEFIIKYLSKSRRIGWENKVLAHYCQVDTSAMHNFSNKRFSGIGALYRIKNYLLEITDIDESIIDLINNRYLLEYIYIYSSFLKYGDLNNYRLNSVFKKISKNHRNKLFKYKIISKKDYKYKLLTFMFAINPKLYKLIHNMYFKK